MADTTVVNCPSCRQSYSIDPSTLGRQFKCVKCGETFVASTTPPPPTPPPPPMPVASMAAAAPQMPVTSPAFYQQMASSNAPMSRAAMASLICGLCCWLWPASIAGLVTGIIGVNRTKNGQLRGGGIAIAGIVLGGIGLVADPFLYLCGSIMVPAMGQARISANTIKSQENLRQIGVALDSYRNQNNGEYPPNLQTLITEENLPTNLFVYPGGKETPANSAADLESGGHLSYTYIPGKHPANFSTRVLLYESGAGHMYQHMRGLNMLFSDGTANFESKAQADAAIRRSKSSIGN